MQMLVGPDGRVWNPYSFEFIKHLGYFGGDHDLVAYAIRNLGFASIQIFPRYFHIKIKASLFPSECLEQVIRIVLYNAPPRIVIERISVSFAPLEVIANINDAVARLQFLQEATPEESSSPNIIGLSISRLGNPKRKAMKSALRAWKSAHGYVTTKDVESVANNPVFGGGALAWLPGDDRCLIEAWPTTYRAYDKSTYERYHGWDVRDLPDAKYLMPTTRTYFTATHTQAPHLELIDALLTLDNGSRYWARYERLLLPWRTRSSDNFVTSVPLLRLIRHC